MIPPVSDDVVAGVHPCGAPGLGGVSVGALVILDTLTHHLGIMVADQLLFSWRQH